LHAQTTWACSLKKRIRALGNIPQAFVHAAFIGAVIDLKAAIQPHDP
jgi:GH15 family glucan-1,4-alpha-glucosidase